MDPIMIVLLVLILLSMGSWGYGYYSVGPGPGAAPPSPMFNVLGLLALLLIVAFVVMLATGWRFGFEVVPPAIR